MPLSHVLADLREGWAAVSFARPDWLVLLLLLPVMGLFDLVAAKRKQRAFAAVGWPRALTALRTPPIRGRSLSAVTYPFAWLLLIVALAGPRWGLSEEGGIAVGRDLVIVLDLSRSMLADDMNGPLTTRCDSEKAAALELLNAIARRGGHRVGLVVFAAKPAVLAPLTTDYDHVRAVLANLDGRYPPPDCRPGLDPNAVSGTRIGAALKAAAGLHDPRFRGSQDIVLLSDGDDPVNDQEWRQGVAAARAARIPVHTVGFGDPEQDSTLAIGDSLLDFVPNDGGPPETVRTRLHETPLEAIAEDTGGQYVPARRALPALGEFFQTRIEPNPSREFGDDEIPQPKERYPWLLVPAFAFFAVNWLRGR